MENKIKDILLQHSELLFGEKIDENLIQFQKTRKDVDGDLTLVLFPFIKVLKSNPQEIGTKIGRFLQEHVASVESTAVAGGFLNVVLNDSHWISNLSSISTNETYGYAPKNSKSLVLVEYASPNTNKPLHLGHLRNIFLGYSVSEILKANGHEVVKTQIINDRGIHICKSMLAWERFSPVNEKGERETPQNTGIKGDKLVGKYYVAFDQHFNAEANEIIAKWEQNDFSEQAEFVQAEFLKFTAAKEGKEEKAIKELDAKIKDLAKNQTTILRDAKEMLVKWESRDPQTYLLWSTMNGWVYEGFEKTYATMKVDFDKLYYESDTYLLGKDVIIEGLQKKVFYKKDDGSVWVDLTQDGLDEKLVLRSDGTAVYMTQDIGTAIDRNGDYPSMAGMVYTVGNEQDYHFKVLFLILKKLGYAWAENCFHLSYGMVDLPSGKMKSREGTVVDADDLMAEVIEKATAITAERGHLEGMSKADIEALCNKIGMGGLKYYLLKVDPKKRMLFDPADSVDLQGNTGPFIQYAHARICSLLAKSRLASFNFDPAAVNLVAEEKELIKVLMEYPAIVNQAALEYSPALIANYTYELVKQFNHFYQSIYILNESNEELKLFRLALSKNVAKVIASAMRLLGIEVPEKM
ncbi:MAG: arginine--tRNA ligase [Bacteroidota bacterium]